MGIKIEMKPKTSPVGNPKYFEWIGEVYLIATVDDWQEVIFGLFEFKPDDSTYHAVAIKRSPSGQPRYQILSEPLAQAILARIAGEIATLENCDLKKKYRDIISEIQKYPDIEDVLKLHKENQLEY